MYSANIIYPKNHRLWLYRGASLVEAIPKSLFTKERDNRVNLAKKTLDNAIAFGADSSDYFNNYGVLYQHIHDYKSAISVYEKALFHKNIEIQTIENLVRLYVHIGLKNDAIGLIESSIRLQPSDTMLQKKIKSLNKYIK
jgi:tetratricopeptide (TPR) repeat protein